MNQRRFIIHNRELLLIDREMLPLAQHLTRMITTSGVIRRFTSYQPITSEGDWIVFRGSGDQGFGVKMDSAARPVSTLQRTLDHVRTVHTIVKSLGGPRSFPFELTLESSPPVHWRTCKVDGLLGGLWCAASVPVAALPLRCVEPQRDPLVRLRIFGAVKGVENVDVGARIECTALDVWMPEVGIRAHGICRGEEMTIEVDESGIVEDQHIPGVRLDLGEIEIRLSDLVGLRAGAVLNLGDVVLERCFIRLGATVLAEGRFATSEGKLMLTIDSVL